jgi:hypothetical protein
MRKLILGLALLSACTTGQSMGGLREGMSPGEVRATLGEPDGFERSGEFTGFQYTNLLVSGWAWDRADYVAIFEDDRLVQWGPGQVREKEAPDMGVRTLVIIRPGEFE